MTVRILEGDCRELLATLPEESVNCCVTSPPYYKLRDYDVAGQMGQEESPEDFVAELVAVLRLVRRALRADGTLWLNIGDSFATSAGATSDRRGRSGNLGNGGMNGVAIPNARARPGGDIKCKDMIGIPWMLAFALRADGWYLRRDIIWHKLNAMPESVRDRPTTAHEYLFLLTKSPNYYYDADAIMEPSSPSTHARASRGRSDHHKWADGGPGNQTIAKNAPSAGRVRITAPKTMANASGSRNNESFNNSMSAEVLPMRNKRSVWPTVSEAFAGAHFATFPPALIEPCILAGCPKGGVVLDPFGGAGTTGMVAERLQRDSILIELNPGNVEMSASRIRADLGRVVSTVAPPVEHSPLFAAVA